MDVKAATRALLGMILVQVALPKLLPLPGVSARWLVLFLGGGVPGILATLVGGALLLALGASWLPSGLKALQLGVLSATAAVASRLLGIILAAALGVTAQWWPSEEPGTGALLGLAVVALVYGGAAYSIGRLMELANTPTRTLESD